MVKTLTVVMPTIDPEFRDLCPPLTEEEQATLRGLIVEAGRCDDIIVWDMEDYPILDGHHRHEICHGEGIECGTRLVNLPNREAAIDFIARIQLGRRSISEAQKSYLRGKLYNQQKASHGGARISSPQSEDLKETPRKTAKRMAEELNVSHATMERDGNFAEAIDAVAAKSPELKAPALDGTIPKSAVTRLATATPATLNRLAAQADDPKKLREATKKLTVTAPRNNGKPSKGLSFDKVEKHFGVGLRLLDDLNRSHPHPNCHRLGISKGKELLTLLSQWKKAV